MLAGWQFQLAFLIRAQPRPYRFLWGIGHGCGSAVKVGARETGVYLWREEQPIYWRMRKARPALTDVAGPSEVGLGVQTRGLDLPRASLRIDEVNVLRRDLVSYYGPSEKPRSEEGVGGSSGEHGGGFQILTGRWLLPNVDPPGCPTVKNAPYARWRRQLYIIFRWISQNAHGLSLLPEGPAEVAVRSLPKTIK